MPITGIDSYNPTDMSLLAAGITGIDFGSVIRGKHCFQTVVIKPILSGTITRLALFLEDNGGLTNAQFSSFMSQIPFTGIHPGDPQISDIFVENPGVSDFTTSDDGIILDPENPEYVWLDALIGLGSTIGSGNLNYRFVFEYA